MNLLRDCQFWTRRVRKLEKLNNPNNKHNWSLMKLPKYFLVINSKIQHIEVEDKKRKESLNIFLQTLKSKSEAEKKR